MNEIGIKKYKNIVGIFKKCSFILINNDIDITLFWRLTLNKNNL